MLEDEIDIVNSRLIEKSQGNEFLSMTMIIDELKRHSIVAAKPEICWARLQMFSYNQSIYKIPYKEALNDLVEGNAYVNLSVFDESSRFISEKFSINKSSEPDLNHLEADLKENYKEEKYSSSSCEDYQEESEAKSAGKSKTSFKAPENEKYSKSSSKSSRSNSSNSYKKSSSSNSDIDQIN